MFLIFTHFLLALLLCYQCAELFCSRFVKFAISVMGHNGRQSNVGVWHNVRQSNKRMKVLEMLSDITSRASIIHYGTIDDLRWKTASLI